MGEQILNFSETFGKRGHSGADDVWSIFSWPSEHAYLKISSSWLSGCMSQKSVLNFEHTVLTQCPELSTQLRHGQVARAELSWTPEESSGEAAQDQQSLFMHSGHSCTHPHVRNKQYESLWQHLDVHIWLYRLLEYCYKYIFPISHVYSHTSYALVLWTNPWYFLVYSKKNV